MAYTKHFSTKQTAQSEPIPGKTMVENNAGGNVFQISCWSRLDRFLVLGSDGGTYYVSEKKLTVENAKGVVECLQQDGLRTVRRIVEISDGGRAPKNDPAIFALALACTFGNDGTKRFAYSQITKVCRIGTHLFQFGQCIQDLRGWSRGLRTGVAKFYTERGLDDLAYQIVKYQQRDGWTHRDVLRLCHAHTLGAHSPLMKYAVRKSDKTLDELGINVEFLPKIVQGYEKIKSLEMTNVQQAVSLIEEYRLPRECVPTEFFNSPLIWEAMLPNMLPTALIRNLGKMTNVGVLNSAFDESVKFVCERLRDRELLKKGRVHPLSILVALSVYSSGHGMKGSLTWTPVAKIQEALSDAFYLAFDAVEPTGKNHLLALDVSGSMTWHGVAGSPLTPREAAAALALVTYRTEPNTQIMAFSKTLVPVNITGQDRLEDVLRKMDAIPMGGTDCSVPMSYATQQKLPVDVFVVYTDNETWAGKVHPCQALDTFRRRTGRMNAKLIVVGMESTGFSIADPEDPGMLDVVGFDTAVPTVMAEFVR